MMDAVGCGVCRTRQSVNPHGLLIITVLVCMASLVTSQADIRTLLEQSEGDRGGDQAVTVHFGLPDQTAYVGKLFSFKIPHDAFRGPVSQYKVVEAGKGLLPSWIHYDADSQTLEGIPGSHDNGDHSLEVTAEGPVVDQTHSVARSLFNIHVQEDSSHVDTVAVPLSQNSIGFQPIRCSKGSPITMATVILDADYAAMKVKEKINMMRKFSKHLDMPAEIIRLMPVGNKPIFDSSALVAGPGDVKKQLFPGILLQWEVGCGNVNARQMQVLQQVETSSQDGKMSQAVENGILGWHVTNNKAHKVHRMKRQVNIQPTATLVPTAGPPTGRQVVTKTLTDTEPTDAGAHAVSRSVPSMQSITIIAPSKTLIHKPHRTKTKGRHSHHTKDMDRHKDKTKYFTATLTPTMGPIKPTRVVDMSSTMVIDGGVVRVTPTEIEPSPGVSRTEVVIEPSIVPTKPTDTKATDILPSRTFTAPIDTMTSGPPLPTQTDTTLEATQSTPMLPPQFTKPTKAPTKKPPKKKKVPTATLR